MRDRFDLIVTSLGFDWYSLPKGSTIVDVGGGIGSTTMVLARALTDTRVDSPKKQDGTHSEGVQSISVTVPRHSSKLPSDPSLMANDETRNNTAARNDVNLRFVVQDRSLVTALGIEAWRSKCPEMLESGLVVFQGVYLRFCVLCMGSSNQCIRYSTQIRTSSSHSRISNLLT